MYTKKNHKIHKIKEILTELLIPILSFREWEIWVSHEVDVDIGLVLNDDQLSPKPYEEIGPP